MSAELSVHRLQAWAGGSPLYDELSLTAPAGEVTAIFGPNGCGKSTLLAHLAGVVAPAGGRVVSPGISPDVSYLFQDYRESLLPWRTGLQNLTFPLEMRGWSRAECLRQVQLMQARLDVALDLTRYPYELSGGQQQSLALLRAFISEPAVILMDEPFSALDYERSQQWRRAIQAEIVRRRPTIVLVSHDLEEAVELAQHIVVLSSRPSRVVRVIDHPAAYPRLPLVRDLQAQDVLRQALDTFSSSYV
jgi:NitT/TauT family transport system ATP-binding protein